MTLPFFARHDPYEAPEKRPAFGWPARAAMAEAMSAVTTQPAWWWQAQLAHGYDMRRVARAITVYSPWGGSLGSWRLTIEDPAEAWEAMAARDLIPASWVDDPRRWFVRPCRRALRDRTHVHCRACGGKLETLAQVPATVEDAILIACDVPGVLAVEAMARELTGRATAVWRHSTPGSRPGRSSYGYWVKSTTGVMLEAGSRLLLRAGERIDAPAPPADACGRAEALLATGYVLLGIGSPLEDAFKLGVPS